MHEKELKLQAAKKNVSFKANEKRNEQEKKRPATQQSNSNKRTTANGQKYGSTKQCLKHPGHKHTWNECFDNPKGTNYKPKTDNKSGKPAKKSTDSGDAKINDEVSSDSLFSNDGTQKPDSEVESKLKLKSNCTDDAKLEYGIHTSSSSILDDNTIEVFDMEEERREYDGISIPKIATTVDPNRSTRTLIKRDCLPNNAKAKALRESKTFKTLAGELKTTE
eukprot:scaffold6731_cov346-Alexandrium_tamarense.AAC.1